MESKFTLVLSIRTTKESQMLLEKLEEIQRTILEVDGVSIIQCETAKHTERQKG